MRKICVFTSTRAEYSLLRRLIKGIDESTDLMLQLIASGTHLLPAQGLTIKEIYSDGFHPDHEIDIQLLDDSPVGICKSMGIAVYRYGEALFQLQPDILIILGDRYEALCCAVAAQLCQIPIGHIHGGETTVGSADEAFRHAITKMSHLHFPCSEKYLYRIIQLGESPQRVFNVGSVGVENIRKLKLLGRSELEADLQFALNSPFFLVTFHPDTKEQDTTADQFKALLKALDLFPDHKCVFTYANADVNGQTINSLINDYVKGNSTRFMVSPSLGQLRYLSSLKLSDAVIGNSSSGIIEAPSLNVPTVNIGDRQLGRIRAESVIDCSPNRDSIYNAISKAISSDFKNGIALMKNPFCRPDTAKTIVNILKSADLNRILKKRFYDLENIPSIDTT